jgi:hypothetical protein
LCRPSTDFLSCTLPVIAGLDPAIHAMTMQWGQRRDFTRLLEALEFF